MLPVLILALAALGIAVLRLWSYRAQMLDMARMLEETPAESNLRLTVRMSGAAPRRLCQAMNARLEEGQQLRQETQQREQELRYTMACISHDIRHPSGRSNGLFAAFEGGAEPAGGISGHCTKAAEGTGNTFRGIISLHSSSERRTSDGMRND